MGPGPGPNFLAYIKLKVGLPPFFNTLRIQNSYRSLDPPLSKRRQHPYVEKSKIKNITSFRGPPLHCTVI